MYKQQKKHSILVNYTDVFSSWSASSHIPFILYNLHRHDIFLYFILISGWKSKPIWYNNLNQPFVKWAKKFKEVLYEKFCWKGRLDKVWIFAYNYIRYAWRAISLYQMAVKACFNFSSLILVYRSRHVWINDKDKEDER